jgi:hypothetical protein
MKNLCLTLLLCVLTLNVSAKPYHDPSKITLPPMAKLAPLPVKALESAAGEEVTRVEVSWGEGEVYAISGIFREFSGTPGLRTSASKRDRLGSYKARLITNGTEYHSSLGTGREFRRLVRKLSFRFPVLPQGRARFILEAEHPETGEIERVLEQELALERAQAVPTEAVSASLLRKARVSPAVVVTFYAEGFGANGEVRFLAAAQRAIGVFDKNLPGSEHFEYRTVFAASKEKLGSAQDPGELKVRDSFLGLYFPYWRKFGRWYHVVYPTDETKYRHALAQAAYDYPVALVDDSAYWGVGNYKELTAVPIGAAQFSYLLLHEFGHFMGLNEEYEGGGPTELEFAPGIKEPWSQNITFNPEADRLKWIKHIASGIPLPSSRADYHRHGGALRNPVGAYRGGYGDSEPRAKSHKPVLKCMMGTGGDFCPVCAEGLRELIDFDRQ